MVAEFSPRYDHQTLYEQMCSHLIQEAAKSYPAVVKDPIRNAHRVERLLKRKVRWARS